MKPRKIKTEESGVKIANQFYNQEEMAQLGSPIEVSPVAIQPTYIPQQIEVQVQINNEHKLPNLKFRRNITLSEELFRRLEYIKVRKNNEREGRGKMITLDQLMFEMVQEVLDSKYPETKATFEKYLRFKQTEGYEDI